jgi:spore germination protein GerM
MDPNQRDPGFARFAFTVITIALVVITLGLTAIYYVFQAGGPGGGSASLNMLRDKNALPPNQAMLYYTKDGRQLVGTPVTLGDLGMNHSEKARRIIVALLEGERNVGMKSTVPEGTSLKNLFINDDQVVVNFSSHIVSNLHGGIDAELLAVYAVVNSLLFNLEGIDAVQILVEDERLPTLGGTVDISVPLIANSAITRTS